jgi:hypothetical protein
LAAQRIKSDSLLIEDKIIQGTHSAKKTHETLHTAGVGGFHRAGTRGGLDAPGQAKNAPPLAI